LITEYGAAVLRNLFLAFGAIALAATITLRRFDRLIARLGETIAARSGMRSADWAVLGFTLLAVATIVVHTGRSVRFVSDPDEWHYLAHAGQIATQGPRAIRQVYEECLRQRFPAALRLTVIFADGIAVALGGATFRSLQFVSLAAFLTLLACTFFFCHRVFGEHTAWWATLLLAASPLHLAMARRALGDSLVATLLLIALGLLFLTMLAPTAARGRWLWVSAIYVLAFLAKEGAVVLIPISFFFIFLHSLRDSRPLAAFPLLAVSVVPLGVAILLLWWLAAGGLLAAWRVLHMSWQNLDSGQYARWYMSGPWFSYIIDYLTLSPWPTLLYLVWLGYVVGARVRDQQILSWAFVPILFLAFGAPVAKNVRYVLALEAPMRLGAVLLLQRIFGDDGSRKWATVAMAAVVAVLIAADLTTFFQFFVHGGIYDPVSVWLLKQRHIVP
jgi:hypothetical protein